MYAVAGPVRVAVTAVTSWARRGGSRSGAHGMGAELSIDAVMDAEATSV
ncbi:hypothetical protein [Streptomyces sp. NPDC050534]